MGVVGLLRHREQPVAEWRPGVRTRLLAAASTGASQLCVLEQWVEPGAGAPTHIHPGVEEVITILAGEAELWSGAGRAHLGADESVLVPPGESHGFANAGTGVLRLLAAYAAPAPPAVYESEPGAVVEFGGTDGERIDATRVWRAAQGGCP